MGQNRISVPHFPAPVPLVPRPGAGEPQPEMGAEGGAGGRRGRQECFLSPPFPLASKDSGWVPWGDGV